MLVRAWQFHTFEAYGNPCNSVWIVESKGRGDDQTVDQGTDRDHISGG